MTRYVIVGAGPAGVNAAISIRAGDPEGSIVILDRDCDLPYYRTELDTYIGGSTPDAEMPLYTEQFYQEQRIDIRLRTTVSRLSPADHLLTLEEGEQIRYDALLLAPGSIPVYPPWQAGGLQGVMALRTWEDARQVIRQFTAAQGDVLVVGGGVLGLILADGILQRGKRVVLVEREARLWAPALDQVASNLLLNALQRAGIQVWLNDEVAEVQSENGRLTGVRTVNGRQIEATLVLVAIGVRPDIGFLKGSGVQTDRGILIDHEFRTNIPGIFAAGDVAQAYDPVTGLFRVVTNWNNAMEQGRLAGSSMAQAPVSYRGVIMSNSETFFGVRVSVLGFTQPKENGTVVLRGSDESKGLYRKLVVRRDHLIGAILVGNVSGEGMMRKFILEERPLTVTEAKSKFLTGLIIEETVIG